MRKELLFEGFELSNKGSAGNAHIYTDISISIQKNSRKNSYRYGFTVRGGLFDLIADNEEAVKFGLRGSMLYFIPTNKRDGYMFHIANGGNRETKYASVSQESFPSLAKFVTAGNTLHLNLKYDKQLELYFVNLMEGQDGK